MWLIFLTRIFFVAIAFCSPQRTCFAECTTYSSMHLWHKLWCAVRIGCEEKLLAAPWCWLVCNWFVQAEFPHGNQLWWWGLSWAQWVALNWRGRKEGDTTPVSTAVLLWCWIYELSQKVFRISRRWTVMVFNLMLVVLWICCQIYSLRTWS